MAEVAAVYSIAPDVRTPDDLRTGAPGRKRPKPEGKRVWASLERDIPTVVEEAFAEADRRDPGHAARWVVLVDGNAQQISAIRAAAKRHGVTITLTLDLVHVIEYLWRAAWAAHGEGNPRAEGFVSKLLHCILDGRGAAVVHTLRGMARTKTRSTTSRKALQAVASYLHKHASMMDYHQHLADGLPVATGVIEGACRHLVADRMDITGARWGLATAEAILRLRAVRSSGDWDEHWAFHARRELGRNHLSAFADHELPELREAA
jgi:hypothetical protein